MSLLGSTSHALLKGVALANAHYWGLTTDIHTTWLIQVKVGFAITFYVLVLRSNSNAYISSIVAALVGLLWHSHSLSAYIFIFAYIHTSLCYQP